MDESLGVSRNVETSGNNSPQYQDAENPWTFTVQYEYGVWCIQFSRCSMNHLIHDCSTLISDLNLVENKQIPIPGFPPPPKQWLEKHDLKTSEVDLLSAPEVALAETQSRIGFVQIDEHHGSAFALELSDLFAIWSAWLLQRFPSKSIQIDPHLSTWEMQISLLWPHPLGQWSQIRPLHGSAVTAFDIVDLGWSPSGELFSRVRTRLVKTSDKSWRTGWMW